LPFWLAPQQLVVMNITDRQAEYVKKVTQTMKKHGFRAEMDLRNEKIGFKIRKHTLSRTPYLLVVGDREMENGTLSVRTRSGEDLGSMTVEGLLERLEEEAGFIK
jgi:threonyl-tRNA synthetase